MEKQEPNKRSRVRRRGLKIALLAVSLAATVLFAIFVLSRKREEHAGKKSPGTITELYRVLSVEQNGVVLDGKRGNLRLSNALVDTANLRVGQVVVLRGDVSEPEQMRVEAASEEDGVFVFSAREIAQNSVEWLARQRLDSGYYAYFPSETPLTEVVCRGTDAAENCLPESEVALPITNLWTMLGHLRYYRQFSRATADLAQAEEDARALMRFCDQDITRCLMSLFPFSEFYAATRKDLYRDYLARIADASGGYSLEKDSAYTDLKTMELGMLSRGLVRAFKATGQDEYLRQAEKLFVQTRRYGQNDALCYTLLDQIEIGAATKNASLLNEAKTKLRNADLFEEIGVLNLALPCYEALFMLEDYTGDASFGNLALERLYELLDRRWDGPKVGRGSRQGGFFATDKLDDINTTDTAYMLYILGFVPPDYQFGFLRHEKK